MTKIVVVAPVHRYNDVRVFEKEAISLVQNGYEVVLFARTKKGESFVESGVQVKGLFYASRLSRFLGLLKLLLLAIKERGEVYHLHNPDTLFLLPFLKLLKKKVVYDTHEDFSKKILLRGWIPMRLRKLLAFLVSSGERIAGLLADAMIVTQTEQMATFKKSILIGNAPIKIINDVVAEKELELRLVYLGGISNDRGLPKMLSLISEINKSIKAKLWLIGPQINDSSIKEAEEHSGFEFVEYLGFLDQSAAFKYVSKAHFGLILLDDVADYKNTSPNKIFEYMMNGTPFVATPFPKWKGQLGNLGAGVFDETGIEDLARVIVENYNSREGYAIMCQNGLDYSQNEYNWALAGEPELLSLYKTIVQG